jgi:hypothetical protein
VSSSRRRGRAGRQAGRYPHARQALLSVESLAAVLRDEVRRGRIDCHSTSRRYELNGGLDGARLASNHGEGRLRDPTARRRWQPLGVAAAPPP